MSSTSGSTSGTSDDLAENAGMRASDRVLVGGVFLIAFAICSPALLAMSYLWRSSDFYGHAYAIPMVAAYLAYGHRQEIRSALGDLRPPALGPALAFGVASFEVLMLVGDLGFAAGLGIPLVLGTAAYAVGGLALLRPLILPLGFLTLMVPPPRFLTYELLFRLKLFVTKTAVALLQAGGMTVGAEGNRVLVPGHDLFVADACSGLISIITLLPLSCIVAYFLSHGVWRRLVVMASVIPLAVGANILRVVVTVQLVSSRGVEFAQGLLHETFGVATYVIGVLAVIGVARVLR